MIAVPCGVGGPKELVCVILVVILALGKKGSARRLDASSLKVLPHDSDAQGLKPLKGIGENAKRCGINRHSGPGTVFVTGRLYNFMCSFKCMHSLIAHGSSFVISRNAARPPIMPLSLFLFAGEAKAQTKTLASPPSSVLPDKCEIETRF